MKKYDINFYPYVYDELEEIGFEIRNCTMSDKITQNYLNEIKSMIKSLSYFPERYRIVARHGKKAFRKVNVKRYSIFYYVQDDAVWISDVLFSPTGKASKY